MSNIPTNQAFKKITSNNITDDYIQLIRGSDKSVLLWVDAAGLVHAPGGIAGAVPGGANTNVQYNGGGAFAADAGFTYASNGSNGPVSIANNLFVNGNNLVNGIPVTITTKGTGPTNVPNAALFITDGVTPGVGTYFLTSGSAFSIHNDNLANTANGFIQFMNLGLTMNGGSNSPNFILHRSSSGTPGVGDGSAELI